MDKLTFKNHISKLINKLSKINGVIYSLRSYLPLYALKTIYYSFAYSILIQNIIIWGALPVTTLKPIQVIQNKIIRNILYKQYRYKHTHELFENLQILKVNQIYRHNMLIFTHKWLIQNEYTILNEEKNQLTICRTFNSRFPLNMRLPANFTNKNQQSTIFNSIKIWNSAPNTLKTINNYLYLNQSVLNM